MTEPLPTGQSAHEDFLREQLQITLGALADIALSVDMDRATMKRKALRIYQTVCDDTIAAEQKLENIKS